MFFPSDLSLISILRHHCKLMFHKLPCAACLLFLPIPRTVFPPSEPNRVADRSRTCLPINQSKV